MSYIHRQLFPFNEEVVKIFVKRLENHNVLRYQPGAGAEQLIFLPIC